MHAVVIRQSTVDLRNFKGEGQFFAVDERSFTTEGSACWVAGCGRSRVDHRGEARISAVGQWSFGGGARWNATTSVKIVQTRT